MSSRLFFGIAATLMISPISTLYLVSIYVWISLYSLPPIRLKERPFLRLLALGINYALKALYIYSLLGAQFTPQIVNIILIILSTVGIATFVYKRYLYEKAHTIHLHEAASFVALLGYSIY